MDPVFVTMDEVHEALGGQEEAEQKAGGAASLEQAIARAEQEAGRQLGKDFSLPADPTQTPDAFKGLVFVAVEFWVKILRCEGQVGQNLLELHQRLVLDEYDAARNGDRDLDLLRLMDRAASQAAGKEPRRALFRRGPEDDWEPGIAPAGNRSGDFW